MPQSNVPDLLSVDQAIAILDAADVAPRIVQLPLGETYGMHLARAIAADRDYPPFDKSLMDGFAVRAADIASAPVMLPVAGEIAAGARSPEALPPGACVAIMTGAPLPPGADGVVPVEDTRPAGAHAVTIQKKTDIGRHISRRGSDLRAGQAALSAGAALSAAAIAVAATVGAGVVEVFDRPRVAVLATGDELVCPDDRPDPFHIRNSNTPMLLALLARLGCRALDLGMVGDDPDAIRERLREGLRADALLVTGGMSMGSHDHVPRLLQELGVQVRISKVRIKPGKPFVYGTWRGEAPAPLCHVFGLPGNPVSGFVCASLLASRVLLRLQGARPLDRWIVAQLAGSLPANGAREFYQPVELNHPLPGAEEPAQARPLDYRGSADLFTLARADALLRRPANQPALRAGDEVLVLPLV